MNFDMVASQWDTKTRIARSKVLASKLCKCIPQMEEGCVLEFGCGTGLISLGLLNHFGEIICTDVSTEMLKVLDVKIQESSINNLSTCKTEVLDTPEFQNKFDVIYSSMVFHHIIDIKESLMKFHALLKPDGYLVIIDLDKDDGSFHLDDKDFHGHNGFERVKLQDILKESDYTKISFKTAFQSTKLVNNEAVPYTLFLCRCQNSTTVGESR